MSKDSFYDDYTARIAKDAENVQRVDEIDQSILHLKHAGCRAFEKDDDDCYTFNLDDKFGFSELLVNQLMQLAYNQGMKNIDQSSYQIGYARCRKEMLESLNAMEMEDED